MKRHLLLFIPFILTFCNHASPKETLIDYETLREIDAELILEIGESEHFLPGRLNELVVTPDDGILVSDWASITIEQFDSTGKHIATIAKEGGGPGELTAYFDMRDLGNGKVLVSHQGGQRDFFEEGKNGIFELTGSVLQDKGMKRPIAIINARTDTTFYATTRRIIRDVQQIIKNAIDYSMNPLVIANASGEIIVDSLYMLKKPEMHFTRVSGNGIRFDYIPYRYKDRFLPMSDGKYMIARPDSNALFVYDFNHTLQRRIPLNIKPRDVTDADLAYVLKDIDEPIRSEIEDRVHEIKPPYLNIWLSKHYLWLHTDTSEKGKEIVVVDYNGNPIGKFLLPDIDEINHIEGKKVYTIHRNTKEGITIRVYKIHLPKNQKEML